MQQTPLCASVHGEKGAHRASRQTPRCASVYGGNEPSQHGSSLEGSWHLSPQANTPWALACESQLSRKRQQEAPGKITSSCLIPNGSRGRGGGGRIFLSLRRCDALALSGDSCRTDMRREPRTRWNMDTAARGARAGWPGRPVVRNVLGLECLHVEARLRLVWTAFPDEGGVFVRGMRFRPNHLRG